MTNRLSLTDTQLAYLYPSFHDSDTNTEYTHDLFSACVGFCNECGQVMIISDDRFGDDDFCGSCLQEIEDRERVTCQILIDANSGFNQQIDRLNKLIDEEGCGVRN